MNYPALALASLAVLSVASCVQEKVTDGPTVPAADAGSPLPSPAVMSAKAAPAAPEPGESQRVGGDTSASVTGADGNYRAGPCSIDTPLPQGYPAPTPPGAIEIKTYPGASHAFCDETRPAGYQAEATAQAWDATVAFLKSSFQGT